MARQQTSRSKTLSGQAAGLFPLPRRRGRRKLKPERVQEYLKSMPGWRLLPGDAAVGRVHEFGNAEAAAAWAVLVAELSSRQEHAFTLERIGNRVTVTLYEAAWQGHAGGVTMAVLKTAWTLG
jgi:pterin-4a-carbinolamine dehydratase